jgi:Ca2+-binding EF-hand superfamily protein
LTTAEVPELEKRFIRTIFARHDLDKSGSIEENELILCLLDHGFVHDTAIRIAEDWMPVYDDNGDGKLGMKEFEKLHMTLIKELIETPVELEDVKAIVEKIDENKNGLLSVGEMANAFESWLGIPFTREEVYGIFNTIQPRVSENAVGEREIGTDVIANWLFKLYKVHMNSVDSLNALVSDQDLGVKKTYTHAVTRAMTNTSTTGQSDPSSP